MFRDLASVFVKISCVAAVCILASGCGRNGPAEVDMKVDDTDSNAAEGTHVVRNNETIYDIAYQYSVDPRNLAQINRLKPPYKLWNGQVLQLPVEFEGGSNDSNDICGKNSRSTEVEKRYEKEGYGEYGTVVVAGEVAGTSVKSSRSSAGAEKSGKSQSERAGNKSGSFSANEVGTAAMGSKYSLWDDGFEDRRVRKEDEEKAAKSRDSAKELSTPKISKKASVDSERTNAVRRPSNAEQSQKFEKSSESQKTAKNLEKTKEKAQKSTPKSGGSSQMMMPVKGRIISRFGDVNDGIPNDGINIKAAKGTSVSAAAGGTVIYVGNKLDEEYGNVVIIQHDGGLITSYAHLDKAKVKKDARVSAGDIIGTVGSTGDVTEPQLYFEVMKDKKPVNPSKYLK